MAANYWASTQRRHWQHTQETLAYLRESQEDEESDLIQQYPLPDRRLLSQFFAHQLAKLGKRLQVRQQALATAQVYMKRFYTKVEVRRTNPYLVVATALYLACKMEECPQHIRVVVSEARQTWPDFIFSDIAKLGECEFYIISELNSQLIIHHPYRTLSDLGPKLAMAQDETSLAWSIINDHYLTDLPLLHPPHVIAVTAIFLAMTLKPTPGGLTSSIAFPGSVANQLMMSLPTTAATTTTTTTAATPIGSTAGAGGAATVQTNLSPQQRKVQGLVKWLAEGEVDIGAVLECSQEIISLYDVLDQYSEKPCKEQIARFVKARGLDK